MKVSLKPGTEKRGLILKSEIHTVQLAVQMTEEEKAAAQAANVMQQELFLFPYDAKTGKGFQVTVKELTKGFDRKAEFYDFLEASAFTDEVKGMLVKLKSALEAKMNAGEEEFEL